MTTTLVVVCSVLCSVRHMSWLPFNVCIWVIILFVDEFSWYLADSRMKKKSMVLHSHSKEIFWTGPPSQSVIRLTAPPPRSFCSLYIGVSPDIYLPWVVCKSAKKSGSVRHKTPEDRLLAHWGIYRQTHQSVRSLASVDVTMRWIPWS